MRIARHRWMFVLCSAAVVWAGLAGGLSAQTAAPAAGQAVPTEGGVLNAIPADAAAFVAVRNLQELDTDIVALARALGFMLGPNGMFPSPLDWLMEVAQSSARVPGSGPAGPDTQPSIAQVLSKEGSIALVLLDCREVTAMDAVRARAMYLLPARDGEALIQALGGQRSDDVFQVQLMGTPFYAATKGGYVAAARKLETLQDFLRSKTPGVARTMSPERVKAFGSQDLMAWVQLGGFSDQIVEELNNTVTGLMMMANPAAAMNAEQGGQNLRTFVNESRDMSFGLAVDARGVQVNGYLAVKPGTELAEKMAATEPAKGPLLIGLPDEPTILAFGTALGTDPAAKEKQVRQVLDQILSEPVVGNSVSVEKIAALKDGIVRMFGQAEAVNFSLSNVPAETGAGLMALTKVVRTGDSAQCLADARKMVDLMKDILTEAAQKEQLQDQDIQAVAKAVQWQAGAEQVAGVSVDHLKLDLSAFPSLGEEDLGLVKGIAGPEGILFRIAPVGKEYVVASFGGGADRLARVIELVKAGQSPLLAGSLKNIHGQLPAAGRLAEGYLHIDQLLAMVMTLGAQAGQPMMMPVMMRNPAPIGFSSNRVSDTAQEFSVLLPTEMVVSVKEAITPLMGMMMGGGMPGGRGTAPGMDMELEEPTGPEAPPAGPAGETEKDEGASSETTSPGPAAKVVLDYLAAAAKQDRAATEQFLSATYRGDIVRELQVNKQSGWQFSPGQTAIKKETIDTRGGKASVIAQMSFQGGNTWMGKERTFFLVQENGAWKISGMNPAPDKTGPGVVPLN